MFRFAPALLVCLLACTSNTRADDAYPSLDQRLGRTITVVEKNQPTEKAVITQVWRLDDGTPCMQAVTQTSKTTMTLVENTSAKNAVDRIKIHRWVNGVRPVGCPLPPATQAPAATLKQTQYEAPKAPDAAKPVATTPTANDKVATIEGGLMPVLPKKEEVIVAPPAVISQPAPTVIKTLPSSVDVPVTRSIPSSVDVPVTRSLPSSVDVPVTRTLPSSVTAPPLPPVTPPAKVVVAPQSSVPAPIKTVPVTTTVQPPAAAQPATPAATVVVKPELVGGCEVVTVTENGVCRKYKVLGTSRDKHGVMTQRCQALDNNEIVTLNCDGCSSCAQAAAPCKPACAPAAVACAPVACTPAVKCEPAKVACTPAPVNCAPAKVACAPVCEPAKAACAPTVCKTECKPCETAKPCVTAAPCTTAAAPCNSCVTGAKPCNACDSKKDCNACASTKACDSCKPHCSLDRKCNTCGGVAGSCDACRGKGNCNDCGLFCERRSLSDLSCKRHCDDFGSISVPVPGVRLNACNGMPGGPPPQPLVPAFCTMNSSSVRCYMNAPQIVPYICMNQPFTSTMNAQISAGIYEQNGANGEAVANTLHLINVLAQSKEWENRQWAAQRLTQATLPTVRPYVEDALVAAAQTDRAPMVKVAAIRTLTELKSVRQDVLALLTNAAVDEDPRIKEAAKDAINSINKAYGVQQAGYNK
ncbi:MAG: HEAT repeat domain-containing protein [Gemmatales bacterium]